MAVQRRYCSLDGKGLSLRNGREQCIAKHNCYLLRREGRAKYAGQGRMASYFMAGANETLHQHTWRPRFFQVSAGSESMAAFVGGFLDGRMEDVGP